MCRLGGVVGLSLAFCAQGCGFDPRPKSVDFHDAENLQRLCRVIIRHVKDPLECLFGKIKSLVHIRIVRAQCLTLGRKNGRHNLPAAIGIRL
ncbi:hypothetical protein TNCV_652861 [Trichonephila clavipes]|nr:hypothetical protein TNCV_652861 [Trichonephila clavipes]